MPVNSEPKGAESPTRHPSGQFSIVPAPGLDQVIFFLQSSVLAEGGELEKRHQINFSSEISSHVDFVTIFVTIFD